MVAAEVMETEPTVLSAWTPAPEVLPELRSDLMVSAPRVTVAPALPTAKTP